MKFTSARSVMAHVMGLLTGLFLAIVLVSTTVQHAHAFHYPWDQGHDGTDWDDPNDPGNCEGEFCEQDPNDCNGKGSPVYVSTGYLNWVDTDIALNGRPYLAVTRSYQSNDPRTGLFGNGWSFDHDKSILISATKIQNSAGITRDATEIVLHPGNGKRYMWRFSGRPDQLRGTPRPVKSPSGVFIKLSFNSNGTVRLNGSDGSYELYDDMGRLRIRSDRHENTLRYAYNTKSQLVKIQDAHNRRLILTYNNNNLISAISDHTKRRWTYSYDAQGNLTDVTNPANGTMRYEYGEYVEPATGFSYNQLTKVTDQTGVVVTEITYNGPKVARYTEGETLWQYTYSPSTRTTTKRNQLNATQTYVYDKNGLIVAYTDANGATTKTARNKDGLITKVTDPLGNTMRRRYDSFGRRISSADYLGNETRYQYSGATPWPVKITSPTGRTVTSRFDSKGNLLSMVDPNGVKSTLRWSKQGDMLTGEDGNGPGNRVAYNAVGQPVTYIDKLGERTRYRYDARGNLRNLTTADGAVTTFTYDALDRTTAAKDPEGNTITSKYDAAGRLLEISDEKNRVTLYTYDVYGRPAGRVLPDGRRISFSYRSDNRVTQTTLEDGTEIKFTYDRAGRVLTHNVGGDVLTYRYDARDQIIEARNSTGVVKLEYNKNGLKTKETFNGETITYQYNRENEVISQTSLGTTTRYTRDKRGYVSRISSPIGRFNFRYDAVGRRQQTSYSNGCTANYAYDRSGGLSQITHRGGFNATYRYKRDKLGLIRKWEGDRGGDWNYTYDENSRLIKAKQDASEFSYRYDASGNRLENNGRYDIGNRLVEDDAFTYAYDERGRLVRKQSKSDGAYATYSWNKRSQLTQVTYFSDSTQTTPSKTVAYTYGPFGRRWSRTIDAQTQRYFYDNQNRIGTKDSRDRLVNLVTFGPDVDEPLVARGSNGRRFFHSNHQGSVMALTDQTGAPKTLAKYSPYGVTTITGEATDNSFWFTGRELEDDDLYFYRARYYDPSLGRFLSEDPQGLGAGDSNLYNYTFADPINYTDPTGTCVPFTPDVLIDVGFIAYDVYKIFKENVFGDCDTLGSNLLSLGANVAGACLPGVTGLGAATRLGSRFGDDLVEAGVRYGDDAAQLATNGAARMCFVEGTPVHTKDGIKAIEDIKVGDLVASKDDATGEVSWKPVTELFRNDDKPVLKLGFKGSTGQIETLGVTAEHPFWLEGQGWTDASDLAVGDEVSTLDKGVVTVASIASEAKLQKTYNFEVEDYHTYFVGESGIWVHNTCWNPKPAHQLWSKGKRKTHFADHGAEFGARNATEYSNMATQFGQRTDVLSGEVGSFIYKFEPSTNTVFVGTSSGRIKTFYKWDGRSDAVIDFFRGRGDIP